MRLLEVFCRVFYRAFTPLVPIAKPFAWLFAGMPEGGL